MTVPVTTAADEFNDTAVTDDKATSAAVPDSASKAELEELRQSIGTELAGLKGLKDNAEIVDKLRNVFAGKEGSEPTNPRDVFIRKEIQRLMPELKELAEVGKLKNILPVLLQTLEAAVEERVGEKTESAQTYMRGRMGELGLDPKDADAAGYLEETLVREIRTNPELVGLWSRGNVKAAVDKAFDKVQAKLFAPIRARAKRGAVDTIIEGVKATPTSGGRTAAAAAVSGKSAGAKVDLTDTTREGVRKIHDGAFDYLNELLGEEN